MKWFHVFLALGLAVSPMAPAFAQNCWYREGGQQETALGARLGDCWFHAGLAARYVSMPADGVSSGDHARAESRPTNSGCIVIQPKNARQQPRLLKRRQFGSKSRTWRVRAARARRDMLLEAVSGK